MTSVELMQIENHKSHSGELGVVENLPFKVERVFWVYNVPTNEMHGGHAHKKCHQFIVPVYGAVLVKIDKREYVLDDPCKGLYIPPNHIPYIYFLCENTTLLVLASEKYKEEDYLYVSN